MSWGRVVLIGFALAATLLPPCTSGEEPSPLRVYFIGNSVTDTVRYEPLAKLASGQGARLTWGRTMIPGAPLDWIQGHPDDGFQQEPFGRWRKALNQYAWDAVSLQPFDRHLRGADDQGQDRGDVAMIRSFAEMAAKQNPEVQIYVFARWPRVTTRGKSIPFDKNDFDPTRPGSGNDLANVDDFSDRWLARYTGEWDFTNESKDYFDTLVREVKKETGFLKRPPLLVPVGHAMHELHGRMKAGKVPGYNNVFQLYRDAIHLNEAGSYLVACTFYATLFRQSPVGLPSELYGKIDPGLAKSIQESVWDVVSRQMQGHLK